MFVRSYLIIGVAICLLTALAHGRGWRTPTLLPAGGVSPYGGGYGSSTSSRGSGGFFSGWGGGK
jgi:hypothetical protein